MENRLTPRRKAVLEALKTSPKNWKTLRLLYYGEERAKNPSTTSFAVQLTKMQTMGWIKKSIVGYEITSSGKELLGATRCLHLLVDRYNKCLSCGKLT
jgi:hypothetical protein